MEPFWLFSEECGDMFRKNNVVMQTSTIPEKKDCVVVFYVYPFIRSIKLFKSVWMFLKWTQPSSL